MLSVYALKPGFQNLLSPVVHRLAVWGVTPNQVTVAACVLSVALGFDLTFGKKLWILLPLFLPVRMALNAIDGMLARCHNQETRVGAVLNEICDLISDAVLTLPFAYVANPLGVGAGILFAALTEVAAIAGGGPRRNHGPFGKSDRAVAMGVCGAWLGLGWPVAPLVVEWLPMVWIGLCAVTIWNRGKAFAG
jgi:CDP-diacylglycerol--glycerol-3-phosphate 3-phosphatidyltransferase